MSDLTIGLLSALLATNQPQAVSNLVQEQTGIAVPMARSPEEEELRDVMAVDEVALNEISDWMSTNQIPRTDTNAVAELQKKLMTRVEGVKHDYEKFLRKYPQNARGFLAYGSFLEDIGDEQAAKVQYENSRLLDPKNPAVWNQLANYYGENGGLSNSFSYYAEAIRLDPTEPVYYQNFATTVYLYRKDAREYWGINEQQVFDKSLSLYQAAMKLAPSNLVIASDYAESYYGIRPYRTNDALAAWSHCLDICKDESEREGVKIHLARFQIAFGRFDEAEAHLNAVTNPAFADLKNRLVRSLAEHKARPLAGEDGTNAPISTNAIPMVGDKHDIMPIAPAAR